MHISSRKIICLLIILSTLLLVACNPKDKDGPKQIAYQSNAGCLVANDFYAAYFSAYLQPSDDELESTKNKGELFQSYCKAIPRAETLYITVDLIDSDIRDVPISIRIVEQERIGEDDTSAENFNDVRTISEVQPKLYPRGIVETHAKLNQTGYYAMYLIIGGEHALSDEDILRIPLHVGMVSTAKPAWTHVAKLVKILFAIIFPILIALLVLRPLLPKRIWTMSFRLADQR